MTDLAARLRAAVRDVPDYPSPESLFRDIPPLLSDGPLFAELVEAIAREWGPGPDGAPVVDAVAGIEARGFILGAPVAAALGVGFVPIRKSGKLPHATLSAEYALEYGTATIEVHSDAVPSGARVLLVDDVLATGGTAEAAGRLLEDIGAQVVGVRFLIELDALAGRSRLSGREVRSLLHY